jgi:hypothetical protein
VAILMAEEIYFTKCLIQRISEWEAAAQRKHDREKAKAAASAAQQVRTGIQEEIETTKKQRRRATREREKARQLDRQREEIHPSAVLSELESLRPPPPASLHLPQAKPDPDREYPVQVLPIRPSKTENDT